MLYSIQEVAEILKISKVTIYKKIKNNVELKKYVKVKNNTKYLTDKAIELLKESNIDNSNYKHIKNNNINSYENTDFKEVLTGFKDLQNNYITDLKSQIDYLQKQLNEKDKQLNSKDDLLKNFQILLKEKENNIKLLEENKKKNLFDKIFKRKYK